MNKYNISTIVLNYNNHIDTIYLLEQLLNEPMSGYIIIVDNDSQDESDLELTNRLSQLNKISDDSFNYNGSQVFFETYGDRVIYIKSPKNGGFAYGNNLGIKYSREYTESKYYLILNNDIKINDDFYYEMLSFASKNNGDALWGSVLYLDRKENKKIIQGIGGKFNSLSGRSKHIGLYETDINKLKNYDLSKLDYPIGACLLIDKNTIDTIGYLNEEYFLYFEELDYIYRMKKHGLTFSVCLDTEIYHKCGATIESDRDGNGISKNSQYYLNRSRYIFMKKYHPLKYYIFVLIDNLAKIKRKLVKM